MRLPSVLTVLLILAAPLAAFGRPFSPHTGTWMWENSEFVFAIRMTKWTVLESAPGQLSLMIEYSELQSFKGAEHFSKSGKFILNVPHIIEDQGLRKGFSRECTDNLVSLLFLKNESGILQPPTGGEEEFGPGFPYDGPISRFQSLKDLLLYAGSRPLAESHSFLELMSGFKDQELRGRLAEVSRSSDPGTAYFALLALYRGGDSNASKLAQEALERCKDTFSPGMKRDLEDRVQKYPPTQPPL